MPNFTPVPSLGQPFPSDTSFNLFYRNLLVSTFPTLPQSTGFVLCIGLTKKMCVSNNTAVKLKVFHGFTCSLQTANGGKQFIKEPMKIIKSLNSSRLLGFSFTKGFWFLLVSIGIVLLLIIPACNIDSPKEYKIGLAINLSGPGGLSGNYIRDGAMLAVQEINERGGINNIPLKLLIEDDKGSAEQAVEAVNRLINKGVFAIIGHSQSDTTLAAYPHVMSKNILLITAYTATNKLTGKDDLFFRTSVDTIQYGPAMANLLRSKNISNILFITDTYNTSFGEEFHAETAKNISIENSVIKIKSKDVQDLTEAVTKILRSNPQAVCFLTEVTRTGILAQKLRDRGYKGKFIATLWAQTPDLIKIGGEAIEGISIITFVDPELNTPQYREFVQRLSSDFSKISPERSLRSYEIVYMLADVLRQTKSTNPQTLKGALLSKKFNVLSGEIAFDRYGDVRRPIYELTVQKGKFIKRSQLN